MQFLVGFLIGGFVGVMLMCILAIDGAEHLEPKP
jgi:hypothetical protein